MGGCSMKGMPRGGQFTWDTYSLSGERAPSGIYLFWITDPLGTQTTVVQGVIVRGNP